MRTMVFIDYQNFNISMRNYISSVQEKPFNIDYLNLAQKLNNKLSIKSTLMKTYLFAYKPCNDLMQLTTYYNYYQWLSGIKNKPFLEIIEGTQEIRQISKDIPININDTSTYTTQEKGTDINLAVSMLSKGYQNAYDIAILVSGDTDYIPVIKELHHLGKIVILAVLPNQNITKYDMYKDASLKIDINFLKTLLPKK